MRRISTETWQEITARIEKRLSSEEPPPPPPPPNPLLTWLQRAGVEPRLRDIRHDVSHIPPTVRQWVQTFPQARGSLLLAGSAGTGKTATAVWCMRELYKRWGDGIERPRARIVTAEEFHSIVFQKAWDKVEQMRTMDLLVLDDIGSAHESSWPVSQLEGLINTRYLRYLPTIVTTNLPPSIHSADKGSKVAAFETRYPRAFDRLRDGEGPGLVVMAGRSLRRIA